MTNLAIDYGNSRLKIGVFDKNNFVESFEFFNDNDDEVLKTISKFHPNNIILSSVIGFDNIKWIEKTDVAITILDDNTKLPFKNLYKTPHTIGKDRICAVAGAQVIYPNKNILIIDAGTAITYDFINSTNEYLGGNISPGLTIRFKSLNHFTKKLPLVAKDEYNGEIGDSTNSAIANGVINGMIFEIAGYISSFKEKYDNLEIILTGGDSFFFAKKLKFPIFVNQNLVLVGLNRILEHNV